MAEDSGVILEQPQTKKVLDVKDPSNADDIATFSYNSSTQFKIDKYKTFMQGANTDKLDSFPGDSNNTFAPTTSPFVIQIEGDGFNAASQSQDPFKIYAELDGYVALIPPLPTSTKLEVGHAFGYVVKSDTVIWIYVNRLTFQKIWKPIQRFDGGEGTYKVQLESGNAKYPLISGVKPLILHFSPNIGLKTQPNFFIANHFKDITVNLSQSPFIITIKGEMKKKVLSPFVVKNDNKIVNFISLFGHSLVKDVGGSLRKVMMVKTDSKLLSLNTSALPQNILSTDQSKTVIENMNAQDFANLEYFKSGYFLGEIQALKPSQFTAYNYFDENRNIVNSGDNGHLPIDDLPTIKFEINAIPTGTYFVVVYNNQTGAYAIAPGVVTIKKSVGIIQIHDVDPASTTLQSPVFSITGFNFPLLDDIKNGATFVVSLITPDKSLIASSQMAKLQINKNSTSNDINNNGTITLNTDAQFKVKFANLNVTELLSTSIVILFIEVIYEIQDVKNNKVNATASSRPITIKKAPSISFLTNSQNNPPDNSKSLVRVDRATKQVIAYGIPTQSLYIVGKNFGGVVNDVSVLIGGKSQKVLDILGTWAPDPNFSAISVSVEPENMNGDVSVEVQVAGISTEPFNVNFINNFKKDAVTTNASGVIVKEKSLITTPVFEPLIPYSHFDGSTLLNSKNTKIASSIPLTLVNIGTKESVTLSGNLDANSAIAITFLPNQIVVPANTLLSKNRTLNVVFNFYNIFNINLSTPKIVRLQDQDGNSKNAIFNPGDLMTVVGTGFANGMRYNINNTGWKPVAKLNVLPPDQVTKLIYQAFTVEIPSSSGSKKATIRVSNEHAEDVASINTSGKQNGPSNVQSIVVNDRYSPLLKINQRLPAGIKMYAKGPQIAMTDKIDANMSIYSQMAPFLGAFKTVLVVVRIIVCIIDVICALINPFQLIIAIIALMDCIIDLLSLFPQLAVPIMILSFLQNFIGFLQTFITQITAYVFSIVNSQLALAKAQISKDFAALAAAEQQAFAVTKQIKDVIAFLEPALQIIQIFKDLLNFAMHFPCAANQGSSQEDGSCPPQHIKDLMDSAGDNNYVHAQLKKFGVQGGDYPTNNNDTLQTMFCQAAALQTATVQTMPVSFVPGNTSVVPNVVPVLPDIAAAIECMNNLTIDIENALIAGNIFITTQEQGEKLVASYVQCAQNLLDQTNNALGDVCALAVSALNSEIKVSPKGSVAPDTSDDFIRTKIALPSTQPNDQQDAGLMIDLAKYKIIDDLPKTISTDVANGSTSSTINFGLKQDIYTPIIVHTNNKSGKRQSVNTIYFNAENQDVGDLIVIGDILEIVGGTFNGLQFPILAVQKIFTAVRLTVKLDITFEQKLLVGEQMLPMNLDNFDVKIIAHLAGNDAIAVVPADNISVATLQIIARDHHGHAIGPGLANNVSIKIDSGSAEFVPIIPNNTTDITGVIQENGDFYIANLKADCPGTVIVSSSVCGIEFIDIGYHANDPTHTINTRKKTVKIIFTPPIPRPLPGAFVQNDQAQVSGTHIPN